MLSRKKRSIEKKVSKNLFFVPIHRSRLLFQTLRKVRNLPLPHPLPRFPPRLRRPTGDCSSNSNNSSSSSPRQPPSAGIPRTSPASPPPSPAPPMRTTRRRTRTRTTREMTETRGTFANKNIPWYVRNKGMPGTRSNHGRYFSAYIEPTGVTNGPSDWGRDSAAASFSQWCTFSVCLQTFFWLIIKAHTYGIPTEQNTSGISCFFPASANAAAVWLITECSEGKKGKRIRGGSSEELRQPIFFCLRERE